MLLQASASGFLRTASCCVAGGWNSAMQRLGASFSTALAKEGDYSLVMAQAAELSVETASPPLPAGEGGITFGVPLETFKRKAIVLSVSRVAGQQGVGNTIDNTAAPAWKIEFEARGKWQNPLQGWNSTADPLENVGRSSLFFFTKEEAVAFAEKAGWEVEVSEPNRRRRDRQRRFNSYGDNFTVKRKGMPDLSHLALQAKKK